MGKVYARHRPDLREQPPSAATPEVENLAPAAPKLLHEEPLLLNQPVAQGAGAHVGGRPSALVEVVAGAEVWDAISHRV